MSALTISRKVGESLTIWPDVTVTVVAVEGQRVTLRIVAPLSVVILRDDVKARYGGKGDE